MTTDMSMSSRKGRLTAMSKFIVHWTFMGDRTKEFDCLVDAVIRARLLAKGLGSNIRIEVCA